MSILAGLREYGVSPSAVNRKPETLVTENERKVQAKTPFPIVTARVPNDLGGDSDVV